MIFPSKKKVWLFLRAIFIISVSPDSIPKTHLMIHILQLYIFKSHLSEEATTSSQDGYFLNILATSKTLWWRYNNTVQLVINQVQCYSISLMKPTYPEICKQLHFNLKSSSKGNNFTPSWPLHNHLIFLCRGCKFHEKLPLNHILKNIPENKARFP